MTNSVDQRVVELQFDNKQFEAGVAQSRDSLGRFTKQLQTTQSTTGLDQVGTNSASFTSRFVNFMSRSGDALADFAKKLALPEASEGLEEVNDETKKFSLDKMVSGLDTVASKFGALSVIGITALSNITNRAINAGVSIAKSLTIDPIKAGFTNYETQIKATQTILANTASEGTKIGDVNKVLAELNDYANKTVYNFSEMTQNIGTFTAAGVKLKPAAAAIKGIANLAALSGSSSEQASTAMYQLSQAIAAGSVHLQDWNSVVNAGLGGKTFQTALVNTARATGVNIDAIIKKAGSFRESLQKGWLTSNILEKTLSQFTGDLTKKQIESMGFSAKQAEGILKTGQIAVNAATQIKTMSQLTDALKEEVGTAWAAIFKTIFGNITQATTLFSAIHNVAENALTKPVYALNNLLEGVDKLGGRTKLIDGIKNIFQALGDVLRPIKEAFTEIFPPATAAGVEKLIVSFDDFTKRLELSGTAANEVKRIFAGIFAAFSLGWDVVRDGAKVIGNLFSSASKGSSGIFEFAARIGDWVVNLKNANDKGKQLDTFFVKLGDDLQIPIKYIRQFGDEIGKLFDKINFGNAKKTEDSITGVTAKLTPFGTLAKWAEDAWSHLVDGVQSAWSKFEPLAKKIGSYLGGLGNQIAGAFTNLDFSSILALINTGLFGGIVLLFKKFTSSLSGGGLGGGLIHAITESIDELGKTLHTMQGTLKAATLLEIAAAIAILTASVSTLSKIDAGGLQRAVTAIGALFAELLSSMAVLQKVLGTVGFAKLPIISLGFIGLATAVSILAGAVDKLSKIDTAGLQRGLTGLGIILGELIGFLKLMPPPTSFIGTSLSLIALAGAVNLLVGSVTKLGGLSWSQLEKGLSGVGGLLLSLGLFTRFAQADKGGLSSGLGIILLATGIKILASAIKTIAGISWEGIGKGLTVLTVSLGGIAGALALIPPESLLNAAAVLIVAASLQLIVKALQEMGKMSWGAIAKSLIELAGSLGIIAGAMALMTEALPGAAALIIVAAALGPITDALIKMGGMSWGAIAKSMVELFGSLTLITAAMILMTEALPGAAALLVVAASLAILTPVLQAMGNMSWGEIGKSMLVLAGVFTIFGIAGALLTPVVPTLIGLGIAVTLVGVGMLTAGAGVLLFATGLTALSISGAAAGVAIVAIVSGLVGLLPYVAKEIGLAIVAFANVIGTAGPAILKAITAVLDSLITAIEDVTPKIITLFYKILTELVDTATKYEPHLISAGSSLAISVMNGIAKKLPGLATSAANLIVAFLNAIGKQLPKITDAGAKLVISFVNGVASAINKNSAAMGRAGGNLAGAIVTGMIKGMANGIGGVVNAANNLAKSAIDAAEKKLHINSPSKDFIKIGQSVDEGFATGIDGDSAKVKTAVTNLANSLITGMNNSASTIDSLKTKLAKLTSARTKDRVEINATNKALAQAEKEHKAESAAYTELTKTLKPQQTALGKLGDQYDALTTKITTAQQTLTDAQKTLSDFNTQITQQYETLPDIAADTSVGSYISALQQQITDTTSLATTLQQLRKMGLNDDTYKQLLAGGVADLPAAQSILSGGQAAIDQVNALDKQLDAAATAMGKTASTALYQAAVDAAAGIVKGLQNQQAAIQKQMDKIADAMVAAIKKKLGIKSPSRVLAEVGAFGGQGFVDGLDSKTSDISKSAATMGQTTITTLAKSMTGMSDLISGGINVQPTITPVLDLSSVKKSSDQIATLLKAQPISVSASYAKAVGASTAVASSNYARGTETPVTNSTSNNYTQNNYSPKALSTIDIYRQTKNQLSSAKGG
jgi:tape measure domain-containing protein